MENYKYVKNEKYDFNMLYDYYGHTYYEEWNFVEKEVLLLDDIFQLPIDDESVLLTFDQYFNILKSGMTMNLEKFFSKLPYKYFLKSPYWEIVSNYKKKKSGRKCQLCNSKDRLNTHHNNYKNRGKEYKNLNDLIVLCNNCHKKFHNR